MPFEWFTTPTKKPDDGEELPSYLHFGILFQLSISLQLTYQPGNGDPNTINV